MPDFPAMSQLPPRDDAVTLQRITQLAADLVGARYGALGVIDPASSGRSATRRTAGASSA